VRAHVETLFTTGAVNGFTDGQLLERFVTRDKESAQAAFGERHGPMVPNVGHVSNVPFIHFFLGRVGNVPHVKIAECASGEPMCVAQSVTKVGAMLRLITASLGALMILAVMALGVVVLRADEPTKKAQASERSAVNRVKTAPKRMRAIHVRVVNQKGEPVANVEVHAFEHRPEGAGVRSRADGRAEVVVDALLDRIQIRVRPNDRMLGWSHVTAGELWPKGTEDEPAVVTLLPLDHRVEGSIVDTAGKPVAGALVNVEHLTHLDNASASASVWRPESSELGSAVTDDRGRYAIVLPAGTNAFMSVFHARYFGPRFSCHDDALTIAPITMYPAGRIVGTVTEAATGKPVPAASVSARLLDHHDDVLGGESGTAKSNIHGQFEIAGLRPGVYIVTFGQARGDKRLTANAVEGVRVKDGEDAQADLVIISGRRLHGTATDGKTGQPAAGVSVYYSSASHPQSGSTTEATRTDEQGQFECFVPPGEAYVYLSGKYGLSRRSRKALTVSAEHDAEPIALTGNDGTVYQRPVVLPIRCDAVVRLKVVADVRANDNRPQVLFGRVADIRGNPVLGVTARVLEVNRILGSATDRTGMFEVRDFPAGDVKIRLDKVGYRTRETTIPVDALEVEFEWPNEPDAPE
jgi:protocatechuate 3,4-dioxygenase beta subunit